MYFTEILGSCIENVPHFSSHSICLLVFQTPYLCFNYTPGIYADGYIVFAFPFVRSSVRMFVSSFVRSFVEFASKFCVKVSQVVYISATTHQKAFIFGP